MWYARQEIYPINNGLAASTAEGPRSRIIECKKNRRMPRFYARLSPCFFGSKAGRPLENLAPNITGAISPVQLGQIGAVCRFGAAPACKDARLAGLKSSQADPAEKAFSPERPVPPRKVRGRTAA
jgi:hypothetical protein